jgi:hypothetical protein
MANIIIVLGDNTCLNPFLSVIVPDCNKFDSKNLLMT